MASSGEDVYCTLVMNDAYLPGAAVLAHSLRDGGTKKKIVALITTETLSAEAVTELKALFDVVIPVPRMVNPNPANLFLMNRGDLLYTFTKIALWRQTQFRRIVYIDSDVVALRAPDELFDIEAPFAAAPDIGWPDAFNSGVMLISPSMADYWALHTLASAGDSFDGADQGLLNQYYEHKDWHRLSFTYNCTPNAEYQWEPAYRHHKGNIKMVHFIGKDKPWVKGRFAKGGSGVYSELLGRWWAVYDRHLRAPPPQYQQEVEAIDHGKVEPTPATEQRRFSPPHMEWDATQSAPPAKSRPEAANFPTSQYDFSDDPNPYQPPQSYPAPPKDMWYEVPSDKPKPEARPKPIFPWEQREERRPTRVFAEDSPPPPLPIITEPEVTTHPPIPPIEESAPFSPQVNAWDNVASIERYVRAVMGVQAGRANPPKLAEQILSPSGRRESLILTDFPTIDDRPSLPVTPAPIRRPSFWGEERDGEGDLPGAEGVPDQAEWNPSHQLEELRRSSLIEVEHLKMPEAMQRKLANRDMPTHAAPIPADHLATKAKSPTSPTAQSYVFGTDGIDGTNSPRGNRGLEAVPEETPGSSMDYVHQLQEEYQPQDLERDPLSPGSAFGAVQSDTTFNQFSDDEHASTGGVPLFSEPEFGREEM
ncbi:hypothetical protein Vi05172_g13569 [Venturia inaequalis]|nr:hypothetical protein Vi05172_g13569 [Venturia inaequalis]